MNHTCPNAVAQFIVICIQLPGSEQVMCLIYIAKGSSKGLYSKDRCYCPGLSATDKKVIWLVMRNDEFQEEKKCIYSEDAHFLQKG